MTNEEAIKILKRQADGYYPKTTEALIIAIKALEREPCEDAISREAVHDLMATRLSDYLLDETREALEVIDVKVEDLSSVTPQPKTGRWIYDNFDWRCSECNEAPKTLGYVGTADFMSEHFKYCNHCGARMIKSQESEVLDEDRYIQS